MLPAADWRTHERDDMKSPASAEIEGLLATLEAHPDKLRSLGEMEGTGGEPDVIGRGEETDGILFVDCSAESPGGRRSLCYDGPALEARSSWLRTPPEIRELGGAMFGDYRFGTVWVYHNGAESYYAARGFRCALRIQEP